MAHTHRRTKIKICGLQSVEVVKSVAATDVDLFGYVLAPSKRRIGLEELAVCHAVTGDRSVGVLVNAPWEDVFALARRFRLGYVQLHGQESLEYCRRLKDGLLHDIRIMKAILVPPGDVDEALRQVEAYRTAVDAFLFDAYHPEKAGGSGTTFHWKHIPRLQAAAGEKPYWIAGGLTPQNVASLIKQYGPYGVDVSSGVESTPGVKNMLMVEQFVKAVRESESSSNEATNP